MKLNLNKEHTNFIEYTTEIFKIHKLKTNTDYNTNTFNPL